MEMDVRVDKESVSIPIEDPFRIDLESLVKRIEAFVAAKGAAVNGMDLRGLLPRMIKGIAGCEAGCPSDAKGFVSRGFKDFSLEYIEGGILSATARTGNGKTLCIKLFPDF